MVKFDCSEPLDTSAKMKVRMQPYRVFISSVMNRSLDDLLLEREAARAAVDQFSPITTPWAFGAEPASTQLLEDFYLEGVRSCDSFVVIVGRTITPAVRAEYDTAVDYGKPILCFAKQGCERDESALAVLKSLASKYDTFANAVDLRAKLRHALGMELLRMIRGEVAQLRRQGDALARLRSYARSGQRVRIAPSIPPDRYPSFQVQSVESGAVHLYKLSNHQYVIVPAQRVADVLEYGPDREPLVQLDGRLQFLSLPETWEFFPQPPPADDQLGIGFGKPHVDDEHLNGQIAARGYRLVMSSPDKLALRRQRGYEVFFDQDGKHLFRADQILMIAPKASASAV